MSDKELKKEYYRTVSKLCSFLKFKVIVMIVGSVVMILIVTGLTFVAQSTIDNMVGAGYNQLLINLLAVSGLVLLYAIVQTTINYLGNNIGYLSKVKVRNYLFEKILKKNNLKNFTSADLMRRAYDESGAISEYLLFVKYIIYVNILEGLVYFFILAYLSWVVALAVAVVIPPFVYLLHIFDVKMASANVENNKKMSVSQGVILQGYAGFNILKLLSKERYYGNIYHKKLKDELKPAMQYTKYNAYWQTLASILQRTFPIFLAVLTAFFFYLGIVDGLGAAMVAYMMSSYLLGPIYMVSSRLQGRTLASKSFERIKPLIVDETSNFGNFGNVEIGQIDRVSIDINKFAYDDKKEILNNFKLELNKGDAVCIVGESGSGKSTLLSLILNQYNLPYGNIKINGVDLVEISQASYYSQVGFVSQASFLFEQSLKENILLGDNFDADALDSVLKDCGLQDFVDTYGIDKIIDEKNENLSGGQLQRVSLARTLIRKPKFILLDEPTASLDSHTAKSIVQSLLDYVYKNNLILMCVSHDKNIIEMFEQKIEIGV